MTKKFKSPLTIYVLWHPKFADGEKLADRLFTTLSRDVNDPFVRTIGIPVFYRSEPAGPNSEAPAEIPLDESEHNAIIVLVDNHMQLSDDWNNYVQALLEAMEKDENTTRVFPVATDFNSFGFEELGATNYIRMFEADQRLDFGPSPAVADDADDSGGRQPGEARTRAEQDSQPTQSLQAGSGVAVSVGPPEAQGSGVNINITIRHPDADGEDATQAATEAAAAPAAPAASDAAAPPDDHSPHSQYEAALAKAVLHRRGTFLLSKLVHELCRLLKSMPTKTALGTTKSAKPIKLFLSHAKADGVEIAKKIKRHIEDDASMKTFFDANDIAAGYEFSSEIAVAIEDPNSALICIQTDYYATREWCLFEVITAKRLRRPLVVLNAVEEREPRSFPYIGNVPTLRWKPDDPAALREVVDMAMLEVLDREYTRKYQRALQQLYKLSGVHSIGHAPELFTILEVRKQAKQKGKPGSKAVKYVLYPDPPLGEEEIRLLEELSRDLQFITPTMLPAIQQQQMK